MNEHKQIAAKLIDRVNELLVVRELA